MLWMVWWICFFCLMIRGPPRSTRTDTLFPYTTLFRAGAAAQPQGRNRPLGEAWSHQAVLAGVFVADAGLPPHRERKDPAVRDPRRVSCERQGSMSFEDIIYEASEGVATITINRPQVLNARSEEQTSELQSLMRISYAVFCLKKKKKSTNNKTKYTE